MSSEDYHVAVIGGGPAGMAAAYRAWEFGAKVILLDENSYLGGILPQCIHPGFGIHYFKEELTGGEFAHRLQKRIEDSDVEVLFSARVMKMKNGKKKRLVVISPKGIEEISASTVIYAAGARERHVFELGITGDRVAGIYTAGEAQALMDLYGIMPGKEILIVGSGDVGLIMARRFALEGAQVKGVVELMPYPGGLARNLVILQDFNIPLYLSHKVVEIRGKGRVERVKVVKLDSSGQEIPGSELWIHADTVIISAGLIPNIKLLKNLGVRIDAATGGPEINELWETSLQGIFAAGNSVIINDLVDYAVEQGERAAEGAWHRILENRDGRWKKVRRGNNIRFVVPHYISGERDVVLYLRVSAPMENATLMIPELEKALHFSVLKPAEMVRISIKKEELEDAKGITVEVKP